MNCFSPSKKQIFIILYLSVPYHRNAADRTLSFSLSYLH